MPLLDMLSQNCPVRSEGGCVQLVLCDGRGVGEDFGGGRSEVAKDGGQKGDCMIDGV